MRKPKTATLTVFILDHSDGLFFFDPKKEGIVFDVRRLSREDKNIPKGKTKEIFTKIVENFTIPADLDSFQRLPAFNFIYKSWVPTLNFKCKGWLARREKSLTIRPVTLQVDGTYVLRGHRAMSPLKEHKQFASFTLSDRKPQEKAVA